MAEEFGEGISGDADRRMDLLKAFVPPRHEEGGIDLIMRSDDQGAVQAYIAVTTTQGQVILSRSVWAHIMPQLLQMVYGARTAEIGIERAISAMDENHPLLKEMVGGTIHHFATLVLADHPFEMARVTQEQVRRAKARTPEAMAARLSRRERRKGQ